MNMELEDHYILLHNENANKPPSCGNINIAECTLISISSLYRKKIINKILRFGCYDIAQIYYEITACKQQLLVSISKFNSLFRRIFLKTVEIQLSES
jgi:hypothetical protein